VHQVGDQPRLVMNIWNSDVTRKHHSVALWVHCPSCCMYNLYCYL